MEDIEELKKEIKLLNKRICVLERKENTRKAFNYIKLIIKIIFFLLFIYGVWRGYEYVVNELPNMVEEKINSVNPFYKSNKER